MAPSMNSDVERAHRIYREGKYREALDCYTHALSTAKNQQQKIALHSNRAACYLKLRDLKKAVQECSSVLKLDQKNIGARMLRAQTLVTLKQYNDALFDANRVVELNPSSEVYRNLVARLKKKLSLAPIPEAETESEEDLNGIGEAEIYEYNDEQKQTTSVGNSLALHSIPRPRGHSYLDYSRWDRVEDVSSEEDDDQDFRPRYKFRVKNVDLRAVK